MLQISDCLLFLMVSTVVLDCCILLVFGLCFCLEYLEEVLSGLVVSKFGI